MTSKLENKQETIIKSHTVSLTFVTKSNSITQLEHTQFVKKKVFTKTWRLEKKEKFQKPATWSARKIRKRNAK